MDIGAEISKKIQMAITAKLKELDAYVDDELPDYIMIMVANKKTEKQMTDALSLFLATNTEKFTSWLHSLLTTLRKAKSDKTSAATKHHKGSLEKDLTEEKQQESILNTELSQTKSDQHMSKVSVELQQESISDDIIIINPEAEDVLDQELLLHQTSQPVVHKKHETNAPRTASDQSGQSKKIDKLTNNQAKDRKKSTEVKKKSRDRKESRSKTDHRTEKDTHSRKRRSDEGRHSHQSGSQNKPEVKSKSRRGSSGKTVAMDREHPSRKRSHNIERVYGLESDSKRYTKHENLAASKSTQVREWDEGKGEKDEEQTFFDWGKEEKSSNRSANDKDFEEISSDEEKKVSSAVRPVMKDPEFVSESSGDSDDAGKTSKVTSMVAYPKRKSRVPPSKQANRALLIKAVSEAEKSVRRQQITKAKEEAEAIKRNTIVTESPDQIATTAKKLISRKGVKTRKRKSGGDEMSVNNKQERRLSQGSLPSKKEVIIIRKNLITGDRVSTTTMKNQSSTEIQQSSKAISSQKNQKPTKVILLEDDDDSDPPVTVIHVRRKLRRKPDEIKDTEPEVQIYKWDKRNFTHRSDPDEEATTSEPVIKFDSRCTEPQQPGALQLTRVHQPETPVVNILAKPSAKVQGQPGIPRINTNQNDTPEKTRFIVTLDGVPSGVDADGHIKGNGELSTEKNFVFKPVVAPSLNKTPTNNRTSPRTSSIPTPKQKPLVIQTGDTEDDHEYSEDASDSELMKMRSKLLKMQEEAVKYKQIQAKLAAAQSAALSLSVEIKKSDSDERSIYISNVHFSTTEKQLSEHFSICGKVQRVTILKDHSTGHPKGFAYLEFEDIRSTESALALDNTPLNSRTIRVTQKQSGSLVSPKSVAKPQRYDATRPFSRSRATKYFRRGFTQPSPRHHLTTAVRFPSRNKTWVNPALALTQKSTI